MLTGLAVVLLGGVILGAAAQKLRLPALFGMLLAGILLGPYGLNLIDSSLLSVSADIRQLALIIILLRAGLALDMADLKKIGRPALLMCFVPASLEIIGMVLLAPPLLSVSVGEAAIMGSVLAAVSPAVVVPKMLHMMERGIGTRRGIPQLIMAGASADDVYVIVLFTAFTALVSKGNASAGSLLRVPLAVLSGIGGGLGLGYALSLLFKQGRMRDSLKVIILLGVSCLMPAAEKALEGIFPFSGLLAVMVMGAMLLRFRPEAAKRLSSKLSKLWLGAEALLFVLVGATVDIRLALSAGGVCVLLLLGALVFRMLGVSLCLLGTGFSRKQRLFCMIAYIPKATVQAAIGGIPLAMGLACGPMVLTIAVLAILITAPLGAYGIERAMGLADGE